MPLVPSTFVENIALGARQALDVSLCLPQGRRIYTTVAYAHAHILKMTINLLAQRIQLPVYTATIIISKRFLTTRYYKLIIVC